MAWGKPVLRLGLVAAILAAILVVGCSSGGSNNGDDNPDDTPAVTNITGVVYLDLNGNGAKDAGEAGVASIVVSNGLTTVTTNAAGSYTLPKEGPFAFVTVPNTHAASGTWYRAMAGTAYDFGLKEAPGKSADNFTFIQMTDVHLDAANLDALNKAVGEFKEISPDFVVSTGDLVNEGDGRTISEALATQWFGAYRTAISTLSMPVYNAPGNHDAANLACEAAAGATAGCSKDSFRTSFGPTYYSFDWGQFHCVVLDPNEVSGGSEMFEIKASQLSWLQSDLGRRQKGSSVLVFCHEPTINWQSQDAVLGLLKQYDTRIFCGHNHANLLLSSQGIPEQVTSALSGEWGYGPSPDGSRPGYRIVSVAGGQVDSFYKNTEAAGQIEVSPAGSTWPIVSGQVELVARVYSDNGPVSSVAYSVDNGTAVDMTVSAGPGWVTARATWDTSSLSPDYHQITVAAGGSAGFQVQETVKVSADPSAPITIKDLQDHLEVYQGHYVTIQGVTDQVMLNSPVVPPGSGGARFNDGTGTALTYVGECYSPALPSVAVGSNIRVRVIPMRWSWPFIDATVDLEGTYGMMKMQEGMIPDAQKVNDGETKVARWMFRVVVAGDITVV